MAINIVEVATRQLQDYDRQRPNSIFATDISITLEEAYAVQREMCRQRIARGDSLIGFKVGCTIPKFQQILGVNQPVIGRLFGREYWPSGVSLPASQFARPAIEGELAVTLARDLNGEQDRAALLDSIESVSVVVELHNRVFRRSPATVEELVASNAIHAGVVYTTEPAKQLPDDTDVLRICINGEEIDRVDGQDLRDTVLDSLAWLAGKLHREDERLTKGQLILCGTVAGLFSVAPDCRIDVSTDTCGSASCEILVDI